MFSYRFFLKQAWNITKKYRYLWFFGLFAFIITVGGEYQIIFQGLNDNLGGAFISTGIFILYNLFNPSFYEGINSLINTNPEVFLSLILFLLLALVLIILIIYLANISQAALVEDSAKIILNKKKKNNLNINNGLNFGRQHFWHLFGLNISKKIIIMASYLIISLPLIFLIITDKKILSLIYILLFLIFIPISLSIAFIIKYAIAARVLENLSFVSAIEKGWKIFKNNWLVSIEMSIILFLINFLINFIIIMIIAFFFAPLLILSINLNYPLLIALSFILILATILIINSILNTFETSAWTGIYIHLQEKRGLSKLERIFSKK